MIFPLFVSYFGFHCLCLWPYWFRLTGHIFQNYLRDFVNEYFVANKEETFMNECDHTNIMVIKKF